MLSITIAFRSKNLAYMLCMTPMSADVTAKMAPPKARS